MGLHIYCIVPTGHLLPGDCTALDSLRPFEVSAGELGIWATEHDAPVPPSLDALRIHNAVILAGMTSSVTPVPVRYGQWFETRAEAADRVVGDSGTWIRMLARFAGYAEYGVRVARRSPETERDVRPAAPQSGRSYMAALARKQALATARREAGERIAAAIAARIGELAVEQRVEYGTSGDLLVTIAHLVAWNVADAYHVARREVLESLQDAHFAQSGPWPPYTFVE